MTSIVMKAPFEQQYLVLRELGSVQLSAKLARTVDASARTLVDYGRELGLAGEGPLSYCPTGQIAAVGLDPVLPLLSGDARQERLQQILQATKGPSVLRVAAPVLLLAVGIAAALLAMQAGLSALAMLCALPGAVSLVVPSTRGVHVRGYRIVVPTGFPAITLEQAEELADKRPTSTATWVEVPGVGARRVPTPEPAHAAARRVADVRAALERLEAEWLAYELNWEAYCLTKPLLRDNDVAETKAYNDAMFDLREHSITLVGQVSEGQLQAAEDAAEAAMRAWDVANDHARTIGIDDRSLVERRALRRLHSLVNQLADPGTPRAMRGELIDGIALQLTQLSTVPIAWTQIVQLPEIQAGEHIQAIGQRIGLSPATS